MSIRVVAKRLGFHGGLLRPENTEFDVKDESELGTWMDRKDSPAPEADKKEKGGKKAAAKVDSPAPEADGSTLI